LVMSFCEVGVSLVLRELLVVVSLVFALTLDGLTISQPAVASAAPKSVAPVMKFRRSIYTDFEVISEESMSDGFLISMDYELPLIRFIRSTSVTVP
jgi:hypothetical protein